ncbi:hypothetical protein KJS94_02890 [Flavihumibacter rivuli]|uniref:hypothetical protein n=1 Tax=Flavihumibacter rivuli TaxID=2838156 RepID=UPI001BDE7569|nr:hypothetical protein [Flavihumibacter rivuli]ULQ57143.1 hypothetical protein KJS94_02890 [Flavihumibacter rivuli]
MTQQIENFTITETSDKVVVDYAKTSKEKFDIILTLTLGLAMSVATFLLLRQGIKSTSYIVIIAGLILAFQAVIQTFSGLSRLFQPTKNLLVIDKTTKTLLSRHSLFASKIFSLDEIQALVVSGQNENISVGDGQKMTRTYCTITAKLKDKADERLFTINTNRFFRPSIQKLETELYSKAKRLTIEINRHLKLKHQWTGYNED